MHCLTVLRRQGTATDIAGTVRKTHSLAHLLTHGERSRHPCWLVPLLRDESLRFETDMNMQTQVHLCLYK